MSNRQQTQHVPATQITKKIAIIGNAGSGKTTLALHLKEKLNLPVIHLDKHYWKANWEKRDFDEYLAIHDELCKQNEWIMEGNYSRSFSSRFLHADVIIFLDLSPYQCLWRVLKRLVLNYGKIRQDVPENCPERFSWEFLKWVWNFKNRHRNTIVILLDEYKTQKQIYILKSQKDLRIFIASLNKFL